VYIYIYIYWEPGLEPNQNTSLGCKTLINDKLIIWMTCYLSMSFIADKCPILQKKIY
jgi:hypothetical protein